MLERVQDVAAEFRKATNKAMASTTKRTIAENVAIETQLSKLNEKSTDAQVENSELRQQLGTHSQQMSQLEMTQNDLAKDFISSRKASISCLFDLI